MDRATPESMPAHDVLEREYLEIRAKLLEVAASLDRMNRGHGTVEDDPRLQQFRDAIHVILSAAENRAEQIQMIFSRQYDADWRQTFQVSAE